MTLLFSPLIGSRLSEYLKSRNGRKRIQDSGNSGRGEQRRL